MRVVKTEELAPTVTRELLAERGMWFDDDGDLNFIVNLSGVDNVVYVGNSGKMYVRCTLEAFNIDLVGRIPERGERITLEV